MRLLVIFLSPLYLPVNSMFAYIHVNFLRNSSILVPNHRLLRL